MPFLYPAITTLGEANVTTPVRSTSQKSIVKVKLPPVRGIHFGVYTNPPVQVRSCSGASLLLGNCSIMVSGSATSWSGLVGLPGGPKIALGANPTKWAGPRTNQNGPYNSSIEGSRKPSPQVLRRVSWSSNGCQRAPTLGTNALVSLFNHDSKRAPAVNSREWNPGIFHFGLKTGMSTSE